MKSSLSIIVFLNVAAYTNAADVRFCSFRVVRVFRGLVRGRPKPCSFRDDEMEFAEESPVSHLSQSLLP